MGGLAWVTLATNDSYSLGALVLAHSLKQVGTTKELAVLITPGVTSAMREKLASVFNIVQEVNILDSKDESNLRLLKRPELGVTFTKLHCWRLTQFDKCVFLDADTLVLQNCDELFDREELSAAPDVGWPDCFNSGVFVYRPSIETYDKLVQFALEKGSFDGGDQGLLNLYFSDWSTKDISKHLPFIYNLCSTACYSYLPAFKQFGALAKIIHFIGTSKPWLQYFDTETRKVQPSGDLKHLERVLQHWWDIFCNLIHPKLTPEMSGLAGAFAQLTLGAPRTAEQRALDDHLRRQGWEVGNIDYLGRDSFDNIWSKICETLSAGPSPSTPTPKPKEPSPPPTEAKPTETTVIEANVELPKQEIPPSAPVITPQETIKDSSVTPTETTIPQAPQSTILEQPKEVPPTETPKEALPTEILQCSLPAKEVKPETVCTLPPKPQEPPVDTAKEISAAEASSPKEVAQPETGDQVPQATAVPASAPPQETPAPSQESPAPPQETPAPSQESPAPPQEDPAPQEIPAPQKTPAPPQEITLPPQEKSLSPQESPVPSQEATSSPQLASAPPQETPAPRQETPPTKQETPAPPETATPVQEAPTPPQQTSAPAQPSPAHEKPTTAAEVTPRLPQETCALVQVTKDVPPTSTPESCPLASQVAQQPPTIPTPETPTPPPTTIASTAPPSQETAPPTAPSKEAAPPTGPSKEAVASQKKAPESVPASPKEAVAQPVSLQAAPPSAPQEAPKTPEVPSTPQAAAAPPEAAQATAAAAAPQTAPPAETPKGKTKSPKEGIEQQKQATAQGAGGATAASPTPPPRKGTTGGKKTKSKK